MEHVNIVAEIGCNHRGEVDTAREMIQVAALCGVDVVKFQKRNPVECLTPEQYQAPHPVPANAYGPTYGAHREALEFPIAVHRELKALCDDLGVEYSSSVWDLTSAKEVASLNPALIKVPSACNTHAPLLNYLCGAYPGELHISLGMTTRAEEAWLIELLAKRNRIKDTVLYACVSGYPVPYEDVALLEVERLCETYGADVKAIGYSGHHLGIAVDVAAITLGATWLERHFTMDRTWKGTDHAASLEPMDLRQLVQDVRAVTKALRPKVMDLLPIEVEQRRKLKWTG